MKVTDRRQTRPLVREGTPQRQHSNFQTEYNIWSQVPEWTWHHDILTDWPTVRPSVVTWLWLWLWVISLTEEPITSSERVSRVAYERDHHLIGRSLNRPADQQAVQFLGTWHEDTLSPGAVNMEGEINPYPSSWVWVNFFILLHANCQVMQFG
jgi:hypothetical protein